MKWPKAKRFRLCKIRMMETMSDGDKRKPFLFIHSAFHKYILSTYAGPDSATSDGNSVVNKTWVLPASSG